MRKLFTLIACTALLAGCGDDNKDAPPQAAATPAPTEESKGKVHDLDLDGYSQGVKDYYGETHSHGDSSGDATADVEAEYHQPPHPAEAGLGETITLTGTNIGVRMEVTLASVKAAGDRTQVQLKLENTGITVYEGPLQNATLTYAGGQEESAVTDETCSRGFDTELLRIDVARKRNVCLLFEGAGAEPERLQLALEVVPTAAGGIWNLG